MTARIFKLRPKADSDLVGIWQYSVQEWGSRRAEAYIRSINDAFVELARMPTLGRDYGYVRPGLRAYDVESHVVFYKPAGYGVAVIRVLHKSMDYYRHL